jgi:hypothetical protein
MMHNNKNSINPTSGAYAAAGPIAITLWRMLAKLMGDPDLPLLSTPI